MKTLQFLIIYLLFTGSIQAKELQLSSPDKNIKVVITIDSAIQLQVDHNSQNLLKADNIALIIHEKVLPTRIKKINRNSVSKTIHPVVKEKYKELVDKYNEIAIEFKGDYGFTVRAYNNGVAYRFNTSISDSIIIRSEQLNVHFIDQDSIYFQPSKTFNSSYETPYEHKAIKDIRPDGYICLPTLVKKPDGTNVLLTESDLKDYPGLWMQGTNGLSFASAQAGYPLTFKQNGSAYGQGQVTKHAEYVARVHGKRTFPWRLFIIEDSDADLITNTLVYQLAQPNQVDDPSWIKPGVVTFDWWGRRNIYGTDFKSGVNTATAKYFIDFAADFGFEYFLFDDGWSKQDDLFVLAPDLNLEEVLAYAKEKDVKIMLWVIWNTFEKQKEKAWQQFEEWGISGIKFDFMNRDDQKMVQFYHEVAQEAAKRKMVIDFHGAYKPTGLRRAYPNVLTREALIEFEYNGWTEHVTPKHDNLLPYIRMVNGPIDYIPFTTHNAQRKNFRPVGDMPMGQGTRAHSMAQFVIYESPMQMFPDSPSDYYRERECTEFISKIPVEWDDLKVLEAKIGEYTVLARKKGEDWYLGAITDWTPREFQINFSFLEKGNYKLECIADGINADTRAMDYIKHNDMVNNTDSMNIKLAPGGGWVARIIKANE
jgi:alpha-glucosidase